MNRNESRLGKGLGALLGDAVASADQFRKPVGYVNKAVAGEKPRQDTADVLRIPVDMVEANPYQPRMSFDTEALEELATSIKVLGLIQPITVRKIADGRYQIISGERRFKACRMAGMDMIPAYVRDATDQGMLEMALVENIQRENLDPIETALSYQRLIDECNLTQENMADRVGKKRVTVTNTLRLLRLPVKVQHDLKVGLLSQGHAKVLLGLPDPSVQEQFCDLVVREDMSVRELENLVRKYIVSPQKPGREMPAKPELPQEYESVIRQMGRFFSSEVSVRRSKDGKGTMTVRFASDDEMKAFLQVLEASQGK